MGGGTPKVVHTLGGGLAKGVLGVYKGGGWVKKGQKSAYVICTQPLKEIVNITKQISFRQAITKAKSASVQQNWCVY